MPWRENKGVANLDGCRRIFFIHGAHGGHGSSEFYPRNYFGSCFARNLWGKSLTKMKSEV